MAAAEVGDDVYGEDPTVRRLEELAAPLVGQEAALFCPSGTMGNQIALHLHGAPSGEVIAEAGSHVFHYEMGAMALLSGLLPRPVARRARTVAAAAVAAAVRPPLGYLPRSRVLVVENTHNMAGGVVTSAERTTELLGRRAGTVSPAISTAPASSTPRVAAGVPAAELAGWFRHGDGVALQGAGRAGRLGAVRPRETIAEARRVRKLLGGGMRQAGIIAAAGVVALERGFAHLEIDHRHARRLAAALAELVGSGDRCRGRGDEHRDLPRRQELERG